MRESIRNVVIAANVAVLTASPVVAHASELPAEKPTTSAVKDTEGVPSVDGTDDVGGVVEANEVNASVATESQSSGSCETPENAMGEAGAESGQDAAEPVIALSGPSASDTLEGGEAEAGEPTETVAADETRKGQEASLSAESVDEETVAAEATGQHGQGVATEGVSDPSPYSATDAELALATAVSDGMQDIYDGKKSEIRFDVDTATYEQASAENGNAVTARIKALLLARYMNPEAGQLIQLNMNNGEAVTKGGKTTLTYKAPLFASESSENRTTVTPEAIARIRRAAQSARLAAEDWLKDGAFDTFNAYANEIIRLSENGARLDLDLNDDNKWNENHSILAIFDEEASTNGACTSYSESLAFLIASSGRKDISVIDVMGDAYTTTTPRDGFAASASHMWNIVRMDDGKNYLVDLHTADRWMDRVMTAEGLKQYLRYATSGSPEEGYIITWEDGSSTQYRYSKQFAYDIFGRDALVLSTTPYVAPSSDGGASDPVATYGGLENLVATIDGKEADWFTSPTLGTNVFMKIYDGYGQQTRTDVELKGYDKDKWEITDTKTHFYALPNAFVLGEPYIDMCRYDRETTFTLSSKQPGPNGVPLTRVYKYTQSWWVKGGTGDAGDTSVVTAPGKMDPPLKSSTPGVLSLSNTPRMSTSNEGSDVQKGNGNRGGQTAQAGNGAAASRPVDKLDNLGQTDRPQETPVDKQGEKSGQDGQDAPLIALDQDVSLAPDGVQVAQVDNHIAQPAQTAQPAQSQSPAIRSSEPLPQTGEDEMVVTVAGGTIVVAIAGIVVSRRKMRV